jgi:glycosyltransferase involved in cell wall biosynthesis
MNFSIITPNFNSGEKLLRAHSSLLFNKSTFEHIIVDDCSSDASLNALVAEYSPKNIIPVWLEQNAGPGNARNIGLSAAKGDYVLFLDADDFFEAGALDEILAIIVDNKKPDLVLFDYSIIRNSKVCHSVSDGTVHALTNNRLIEFYMKDKIISSPWCKCIKTHIAQAQTFPDLRVQQDSLYNFNVFLDSETAIHYKKCLYGFDKSFIGSLTTKPFTKTEMLKFYKSHIVFKKLVMNSNIANKETLLAVREIKACSYYYINRLVDNGGAVPDAYVIKLIKKVFVKNVRLARKHLSYKGLVMGFVFLIFPRTVISLLRWVK